VGFDRIDRTLSHLSLWFWSMGVANRDRFRQKGSVSPPAPALQVSETVLGMALRQSVSQKAEYRIVVRARIVRDAVEGFSNEENARRNAVRPDTVRKYRERAMTASVPEEAFADAPRSGRPPRIAVETRTALIQLACARPEPELEKSRARARRDTAKTARKAASKALNAARKAERRAARQEQEARERQRVQEARRLRRKAQRDAKQAEKALLAAETQLIAARADVARAIGTPASFSSVWTYPTLQAALERETGASMSLAEIGRTLNWGGLRPHRVRIWLHSADPDFAAKSKAICELYLNPPSGVVLCVDEKTGVQARADLHPVHMSAKRGPVRREFEYRRNGTTTLIAAFNINTGEVVGRCWPRTADGIIRFLKELKKHYPTGDVHIVWDNLNVHKNGVIEAFRAANPRFHFVYTPLHASWMNQVEIWFSILQRRVLKHGSFTSTADLEAAMTAFIRHWNASERRPFRWRFRGEFAPQLSWAA
jgi:transposase